jgi:hypothetical protein
MGGPGEVTDTHSRELHIQIDRKLMAQLQAEAGARAEAAKD